MIESEICNLISSLGFPVVAFLLMYRMANSTIKENTKAIISLRESFRK